MSNCFCGGILQHSEPCLMMQKKMKPPKTTYKCYVCDRHFDVDGEEIYLICNKVLGHDKIENVLRWQHIKEEHQIEVREHWFHRDCFLELAGKKFIARRKEKGVNET